MASPEAVSIVRAAERDRADAEAIVFEYLATIREHVSRADVVSEVANHCGDGEAALFVARSPHAVLGCITVHPLPALPGAYEIKRLYVVPAARGMGLAVRLMEAAEAHAEKRGARRIVLDTKETMTEARRLYERLGYAVIPRYHDRPDIHLFMGKEL